MLAKTALRALRKRRKDQDLTEIVAIGREGLRNLVRAHIDHGLSKFVVRPLDALSPKTAWRDELRWLGDAVLPLQT